MTTRATHTHFTSDKGHTHTGTPTLEVKYRRRSYRLMERDHALMGLLRTHLRWPPLPLK